MAHRSLFVLVVALGSFGALDACSPTPSPNNDAQSNNDASSSNEGGSSGCSGGACPRVTSLSIGYQFTVALIADGTVRCWGRNEANQCGDGTTTSRPRPATVAGLSNVTQVAAGSQHACALRSDGTVWCWGSGSFGRLGNGSTNNNTTPAQVMGVTGATQIAVGFAHGCAVLQDKTVSCWGRGGEIGSRSSSMTAIAVPGLTRVTRVVASAPTTFGGSVSPFSCALREDGSVWCWGSNDSGQLATGTTDNMPNSTDAIASLITAGAQKIAAGGAHACVVQMDGAVRCWGNNLLFQLGDGTQDNRATPVSNAALMGAGELALGRDTTCALMANGTATCLGANGSGQLGRGTHTTAESMAAAVAGLSNITALALGEDHACAATSDGVTRCWGANAFAQLGIGVEGDAQYTPTPVAW